MKKAFFQFGRLQRLSRLALLSLTLCAQMPPARAEDESKLRVACFVERDNPVNRGSVRSALENWFTSIKPTLDCEIISRVESDSKNWFEAIEAGSHDLFGLFTYQYLELDDPTILRPCLSIEGDHGTTSTFLLITRQKSEFQSVSQLRDKRIVVDTAGHGNLPLIWLATQIGKVVPAEEIRDFAQITPVQRPHRAFFPVYFGKADACIITRKAFMEATKINPDLTKKLGDIANSKPLLVSILAFHRDYPLVPAEKVTSNALNSKDGRSTKNLFELLDREGIDTFKQSSMFSVTTLHNEFQALFAATDDEEGAIE